jgi:8-oxo-dGTP diphosphatase
MPDKIALTVDAVVFGYTPQTALHVLLIQRKLPPFAGHWALPGGFVRTAETLEGAVQRTLREESGIEPDYLEQLFTFGNPGRDPRGQIVSVAYYVLVKPSKFTLETGADIEDVRWWPLHELPGLAFDHQEIIHFAHSRLKSKVTYEPIGFELLDEVFPFSHLEHLYTTLLDYRVDRRNFRKKMLMLDILEMLSEKSKGYGSGRPAALFRFNRSRYFEFKQRGHMPDIFSPPTVKLKSPEQPSTR